MNSEDLYAGQKVTYDFGFAKENGIVKYVSDGMVFVVYQCNGDWDNYQKYTGESTNPENLIEGWNE
jgi:hypothetical protein